MGGHRAHAVHGELLPVPKGSTKFHDFDEFERSLKYVAKVSDDYDDELQSLGGGQRAEDVLREG